MKKIFRTDCNDCERDTSVPSSKIQFQKFFWTSYRIKFEPLDISNLTILVSFYSVTKINIISALNVMNRFTFEQHCDLFDLFPKHRQMVRNVVHNLVAEKD